MYEELIEELRLESVNMHYAKADCELFAKAADAIEELSAYAELYKDLAEKNQQMARKLIEAHPRWISVEERLPTESEGTILVCFPNKPPYNQKEPFVNAKHNQRITTAHYSQFSKTWYIGDFCAVGREKPIAWMELPEPPKEETTYTVKSGEGIVVGKSAVRYDVTSIDACQYRTPTKEE